MTGATSPIGRLAVVAVAVLLVAVQIVRNSAVQALAQSNPGGAATFWSAHPAVQISSGLSDIGAASRQGKDVRADVFSRMRSAAAKSPLSPEPFLVEGVRAQLTGAQGLAERAFVAAQWRNPRSLPAAYFLSNYYLLKGDTFRGLQQLTILSRLSPNGADTIAPFVAAYGKSPANAPLIRRLFAEQPGLGDAVLGILARDPQNADALLRLSGPVAAGRQPAWLGTLLGSLVTAGDFPRARQIWMASLGRSGRGELVYDPTFSAPDAPPPFNWLFADAKVGLAERQSGGRLHVLFYGNDDGPLASQLLVLPAGTYRLRMRTAGPPTHPELLSWRLRCGNAREPVASAALAQVASGGWTFRVPANCAAQWLELFGRSEDVAQQAEVTISGFSLASVSESDG